MNTDARHKPGSAQVAPAAVPGVTGLFGLAIAVVVIAGLYFAQDVLIPITLAILLSFVLSPIVELLRRCRCPKTPAVLVAVLLALGALGGIGTIVGIQAASLSGDALGYARPIEAKVEGAKAFAADRVAFFTRESARARPAPLGPGVSAAVESATREPIPVRVTDDKPDVLAVAGRILGPVLGPFETFVIVLAVVEPLLYGHSIGLSPLSVVLAAVFWTWNWGPVGLVLAMPVTLCLVVLGRHVPSLAFLDVLLGDRPAFTPAEGFYQRMLADDPAEALKKPAVLLEERSLTAYYDEVALGGLKLAAEDARRGVVDRARARRIVDGMLAVIDDLDDAAETAPAAPHAAHRLNPMADDAPIAQTAPAALPALPAAWRDPGSITCIAGRGVLDDAVTAMPEQSLAHRGFGVRRVDHAAVGRDAIGKLDLGASKLICLSYLEVGGTPSHLRYLVRRLRAASGGVPVMVGVWPEGEAALGDAQVQHMLGADLYVGTLGKAVEAALELAGDPVEQAA